jgi:collagenase-like PrtC family protease
MARFSMPFNGDPALVDAVLADHAHHVASFYGSLIKDPFGGGRALNSRHAASLESLAPLIRRLNDRAIEFNYVLNGTNLLNREFDPAYQQSYLDFLRALANVGVSKVTLSNIHFIELTKARMPGMKISASVNLKTRTPAEVQFLLNLGCDEITLHYDILKDRQALVGIRALTPITLKLIPNDVYVMGCPWQKGHTRMQAAHSRTKRFDTPYFSYYRNKCVNLRHQRPDEVFKAMWIPPDQIDRYESLGFSDFKLLDRLATTAWNLRALEAYLDRRTDRLETLLGTYGAPQTMAPPAPLDPADGPYPMTKLEVVPSIRTQERSSRLFEYFLQENHPQNCGTCAACGRLAKDTMVFPASFRAQAERNNREWQSQITKLPFIRGLGTFSRRIPYD